MHMDLAVMPVMVRNSPLMRLFGRRRPVVNRRYGVRFRPVLLARHGGYPQPPEAGPLEEDPPAFFDSLALAASVLP